MTAIKFLIDNALAPKLSEHLRQAGFDAIHVRDRSMASADDAVIFEMAAREDRVIVSQDTDFGTLLALRQAAKPSVILFRRNSGRRAHAQFDLLVKNLSQIDQDLRNGSIVIFEQSRVRVRTLPIGRDVDYPHGTPIMRPTHPITAYIALGANIGARERSIHTAIQKLRQTPGVEVVRVSRPLENPAEGMGEEAPAFLNSAAEIHTTLGAHALLQRMLEIEREMGRERGIGWEPRVIDLDLLLYGNQILSSQDLMVPHPLMHERRFVLEPLAEIAADVVHPTLQMTIAGLLEAIKSRGK